MSSSIFQSFPTSCHFRSSGENLTKREGLVSDFDQVEKLFFTGHDSLRLPPALVISSIHTQ